MGMCKLKELLYWRNAINLHLEDVTTIEPLLTNPSATTIAVDQHSVNCRIETSPSVFNAKLACRYTPPEFKKLRGA